MNNELDRVAPIRFGSILELRFRKFVGKKIKEYGSWKNWTEHCRELAKLLSTRDQSGREK